MRINITTKRESIGLQMFDALYAYRQSLTADCGSDWDIVSNQPALPIDFSVLHAPSPDDLSINETQEYDLVFLCNGGEPLSVATHCMVELIKQDNVYIISNSFLTKSHQLYNKVFPWPDAMMQCRDYWCRHFYPQYFENLRNANQEKKWAITAINGQNRLDRHWLFSELLPTVPGINIVNNATVIEKLNDLYWSSNKDQEFHHWLTTRFDQASPKCNEYYLNPTLIGMQGKFGEVPLGYFIMSEYWQSDCVIWSESTWQNDELCITEKACKCFYSQTIPWPVGGSNIHTLYEEQGFYTAWHLLPTEYQQFDSILDHYDRYHAMLEAMSWVANNPGIFCSEQAKSILQKNQTRFLLCAADTNSVIGISNLFEQYAKQ